MAEPTKHLLTLSTLEPDRPTVSINGVIYEMAVRDDFGLREQARFLRLEKRFTPLQRKPLDEMTDDEITDLESMEREMVTLILPGLPGDVLAGLRENPGQAIIRAFTMATGENPATSPPPLPPNSTSGNSSLASNDSTAAAPANG